jgi:fermentation-respiration switch protein FrsA (DUF1100 family)
MIGGTKAHYDCIKVFSETDHTENLKRIAVPVLVMHSEDDQIVPFADSGPLAAKLPKNGTLKAYKDLPHGMPTAHAEIINADLPAFFKSRGSTEGSASGISGARRRRRAPHHTTPHHTALHQSHQCRVMLMMKAAGTPITAPTKP